VIAYSNIGYVYHRKGESKKALDYAIKAREKVKETGDSKLQCDVFVSLAMFYSASSDYEKALDNYIKALKIYDDLKDENGISHVYNSMGNLYYQQRNYPKAIEHYEKAIVIFEKLKKINLIGMAYTNLGVVYNDSKLYDKAEDYLNKALLIFENTNEERQIADINTNLGITYYERGDYKKALESHLKAKQVYEKMNARMLMGISYNNLGDVYLKMGNFAESEHYLTISMDLARSMEDLEGVKCSYESLAALYAAKKDYKAAYEHQKMFSLLKDSLMNFTNMVQINEMQSRYETDKKDKEIELLNKDKIIQETTIEKQNNQRIAFIAGLLLLSGFLFFVFRSYKQKQKANVIITKQKEEVEKQKLIIEGKNKDITDSINYAKRIQTALMRSEKYIQKNLEKLKKG
jgi:tetratricopeptide (TPR) repeat protein